MGAIAAKLPLGVALGFLAAAATAQNVPLPPAAAASAPRETVLPPVVVTGEKSQRTLERTAPSVKVYSGAELDAQPGLRSSRALLEATVNVTATGTQNRAPAVRGIDGTGPSQGSDAFLAGTRSRLNVVVDGRPASYNEITFGDLGLWDAERVEVFRGAQSALQGRNAIAGTIVYRTHEPSYTPEFGARVLFGNRSQRQVSALLSGPLVDEQLALRIALDRATGRSFVRGWAAYEGVDDPGEFETSSARFKLLVTPKALPGFRTVVTLARTEHRAPQTEGIARPFDDLQSSYPAMPVFAPRVTSGTVETGWRLSDRWSFENSLVAGNFKVRRLAVPGDGNALIDGHDFALEPRLRYTSADRSMTGFVGLYAFNARQRDTLDLFGGGAWDDWTQTRAIYGEATIALRPDLELITGARYEREQRTRRGKLAFFVTDFDRSYNTFLPKLSLAWKTDAQTTLGAAISRGYNGGNAGFTYDEPYVNYDYEAEYVWNLEAFARATRLGGRLQLTGNLFVSRYKDMQTPFDLNPDPAIWAYVVRNAPKAQTYGGEFAAVWQATPALKLNAELGLLRARITAYPDSGVEGHELPRAPRVSLVLGGDWRAGGGVTLGASARYSSAYYSDITNVARGRVEPGWIANLNAGWTDGRWRLFAYVNNVFDAKRPILIEADPNAGDDSLDVANLPRPRTVGIGAEVWF
jgi:iron complex outermembrane receptor protein